MLQKTLKIQNFKNRKLIIIFETQVASSSRVAIYFHLECRSVRLTVVIAGVAAVRFIGEKSGSSVIIAIKHVEVDIRTVEILTDF